MEIPHAKWSRNTHREDGKQSACNHETLAVREENVMVARVKLHNMKQDRSESIHYFGTRFQGQAGVCRFTQQCTNCNADVDYTEAILRDVLCQGLEYSEIQLDLLGNKIRI